MPNSIFSKVDRSWRCTSSSFLKTCWYFAYLSDFGFFSVAWVQCSLVYDVGMGWFEWFWFQVQIEPLGKGTPCSSVQLQQTYTVQVKDGSSACSSAYTSWTLSLKVPYSRPIVVKSQLRPAPHTWARGEKLSRRKPKGDGGKGTAK